MANHPDPQAVATARALLNLMQTAMPDNWEAEVYLIGSRNRGDHRDDSDIDLIVDVRPTDDGQDRLTELEAMSELHNALNPVITAWQTNMELKGSPSIDVAIVEQWGSRHGDDRENDPPDALMFTTDNTPRESIPERRQWSTPAGTPDDHPEGTPIYFRSPRIEFALTPNSNGHPIDARYVDLWNRLKAGERHRAF